MGNAYTNAKKDLTGTSVTTLYTAPSLTTSIVTSILVAMCASMVYFFGLLIYNVVTNGTVMYI